MRKSRIVYMECKGEGLSGPARVGRVTFSRSGMTVSYRGRQLQRLKGAGFKANHFDVETGEHWWICGPRRDGLDRLYGERVPVEIDDEVREEYWVDIRRLPGNVGRSTT